MPLLCLHGVNLLFELEVAKCLTQPTNYLVHSIIANSFAIILCQNIVNHYNKLFFK